MGDLFLQEGDGLSDKTQELFVREGLSQIVILRDLGEQMGAMLDQGGQLLPEGIGPREWLGREGLSKVGNERGIDLVGLGQTVFGFGKIAHLARVELDERTLGLVR